MYYEVTTLSGSMLKVKEIGAAASDWTSGGAGTLLGSWRSEIGQIGQTIVLRSFDTKQLLEDERRRALLAANPFCGNGLVERLKMESYEGFPFLPNATPRKLGGIYEIRTYFLKNGGLPPTLEGWQAAIGPAREYTDHLVINMFALDGRPRITHFWGFESLDQRFDLRERHYAAGLWPPKGGPEQIAEATSTIAIANKGSPFC